jgi:hypothetical protein
LFYRISGLTGLTGFYSVLPVNPVILLILSVEEPHIFILGTSKNQIISGGQVFKSAVY